MDKVQKFISENQHQLGYIMHEASRQWIENDDVGALTVGDCNFVVQKHGKYHELLEKLEKQNSKVEYYEMKIQELFAIEMQLENGELDGFDHSEKVSRFIEELHLKL